MSIYTANYWKTKCIYLQVFSMFQSIKDDTMTTETMLQSWFFGWFVKVNQLLKTTDVCLPCRYHCSGDLHHLMYSGVPDPLHVPSQRHLPHQRGQEQRRVRRRIGRHGHHRHGQPRNHRRIKEGVVHLTANGRTLREEVIRLASSFHRDGGFIQ